MRAALLLLLLLGTRDSGLGTVQAPSAASVAVAPDSPASLQVGGDLASNKHVYLYWEGGPEVLNAPPPALTGVNVYRSEVAGGPYTLLTPTPLPITDPLGTIQYEDFPRPANTYYYVMNEIDAAGAETDFSPEMQAVIP